MSEHCPVCGDELMGDERDGYCQHCRCWVCGDCYSGPRGYCEECIEQIDDEKYRLELIEARAQRALDRWQREGGQGDD